jgi:membrane-associated protease RseP (regulator of RpoE activity)
VGLPPWPGGSPPAPIAPSPRRSAWWNLVLFLLTAASVFMVGGLRASFVPGQGTVLSLDLQDGARLALGLLSILMAHEMGHSLAARYYGVDVTLPYFIPFPIPGASLVGTLGAFIRIKSAIPNRRALFDIGVAGPLAGFAVCLPVLWLGIREATIRPIAAEHEGMFLGEPLLFRLLTWLAVGSVPADQTLVIGPLGLAGWFGLLVTALNLMPIGQLDGGHVAYSLLLGKAHRISQVASWLCVALIYFGPSWILWAILARVLARRHPPTRDDAAPVGRARAAIGLLSLAVFVGSFVPDPIVVSWHELLQDTPLERFLP